MSKNSMSIEISAEDLRQLIEDELRLDHAAFARMVGTQRRTLAAWLADGAPGPAGRLCRLLRDRPELARVLAGYGEAA